jgi:hypothetical protein
LNCLASGIYLAGGLTQTARQFFFQTNLILLGTAAGSRHDEIH